MIKKLSINGLRGFGEKQSITFALPNDKDYGSGLTIITGSNNSGKTTIIEAIRAFNGPSNDMKGPSFSEGKRNVKTNHRVELCLTDEKDKEYVISTVKQGGSLTEKSERFKLSNYVVPSRRAINFTFSQNNWNKDMYIETAQKFETQRNPYVQNFEARLFQIQDNKEKFDRILNQVLGKEFRWLIEQDDQGRFYIKCVQDEIIHSSEGIGDGIWSVFTICAALYDAAPNSVIVIDEPELSVHPALQKRIMKLLVEYSKEMQIIVSTHSPYFVNWDAIANYGAHLVRVVKEGTDTKCFEITQITRDKFKGLLNDLHNPHVLGLEANEALFLEDNIILVEGQEDVVILTRLANELGIKLKGEFFGWGVGGASKMQSFMALFSELGYKHVVALLDGDKKQEAEGIQRLFPNYKVIVLSTDDIRDKVSRTISAKNGIVGNNGQLKSEYRKYAEELLKKVNEGMS